jgi:hypothetical protein
LAANSEEKVKGRQFCAGIFKKMGKKIFLYLQRGKKVIKYKLIHASQRFKI